MKYNAAWLLSVVPTLSSGPLWCQVTVDFSCSCLEHGTWPFSFTDGRCPRCGKFGHPEPAKLTWFLGDINVDLGAGSGEISIVGPQPGQQTMPPNVGKWTDTLVDLARQLRDWFQLKTTVKTVRTGKTLKLVETTSEPNPAQ
jgi:hypothetical protein